jgi:hypothetical protein
MLSALEEVLPWLKLLMVAALKNVRPGHLLDRELLEVLGAASQQATPVAAQRRADDSIGGALRGAGAGDRP